MARHFKSLAMAVLSLMLVSAPAFAGLVEGDVDPINSLSAETYESTDFSGATSLDEGGSDVTIAGFAVNDNHEDGWKLTVTSANNGKLIRAATITVGDSATVADEILYTNIKLTKTGGTLGTGLTDPSGTSQDVTSGTCAFDTGTEATATTATLAYAADLQITWAADSTLLQGYYRDTLTMTLSVDDG